MGNIRVRKIICAYSYIFVLWKHLCTSCAAVKHCLGRLFCTKRRAIPGLIPRSLRVPKFSMQAPNYCTITGTEPSYCNCAIYLVFISASWWRKKVRAISGVQQIVLERTRSITVFRILFFLFVELVVMQLGITTVHYFDCWCPAHN